ncbi:site-specific DNA-methyltransferase [Massilia rhizosphaerae]|uniref:site-specific DNA-methyltransferase n=1 Tax=Massilia rhizosphaerae TaxID=2784389 RepID=UPI0018DE843D|nr:site-specific DNA-methyltransferase [Massilia rhizosphaerae]
MSGQKYNEMSREDLIRLLSEFDSQTKGGIRLSYPGQTPPWHIIKKVQPRRQKIDARLSVGEDGKSAGSVLLEGENLQAMVSLYKYRGQVDLILTDPPYNTGLDFRYNDKWDIDPNDPDLGDVVPADDGSRHSKWLRFMTPRLWMMKEMLRPGGVLAICIDHRELYRLGMQLDAIFGEENRIAIINWQKTYSPKSAKHVSTATEYVLVYAKDLAKARTGLLSRIEDGDDKFKNPDNDPKLRWRGGDPTAKESRAATIYGIQSPFTGYLHYPEAEYRYDGAITQATRHWSGFTKDEMKASLEAWGTAYTWKDIGDGRGKALVIEGSKIGFENYDPLSDKIVQKAKKLALKNYDKIVFPRFVFLDTKDGRKGEGRPAVKRYLDQLSKGRIPWTYWADEDYSPIDIGTQSWGHEESGHSQTGINELDQIIGKGHKFETVKPLKLFKKIIHLWSPKNGIVLDPFAGSGTTGHAVLELNKEAEANRRFILIEQGRPERGDPYARGLTAERLRRAILGLRPNRFGNTEATAAPLPGGFRFVKLEKTVDAEGVLALEREEMIDLLITSHWDQRDRAASSLVRIPVGDSKHLFAIGSKGEGFFLTWTGPDGDSTLNRASFREIAEEAKRAGVSTPYHVYARRCTYSGPNVEFYQIPNRILEKLGFNEALQPYSSADDEQEAFGETIL